MCCEIFYVYALRHLHAHCHALYQFSDDVCATLYSIDGQRWVSIIFGIDIDTNPLMNKCMNGKLCKQWRVVSDIITLGYIKIIMALITYKWTSELSINVYWRVIGYCSSSLLSPPTNIRKIEFLLILTYGSYLYCISVAFISAFSSERVK